jgi:hypothetical protein
MITKWRRQQSTTEMRKTKQKELNDSLYLMIDFESNNKRASWLQLSLDLGLIGCCQCSREREK